MPAGRKPWRHRPQRLRVLEVMADGLFYGRPVLRARLGLSHNCLSPCLIWNFQHGRVSRHRNPLLDGVNLHDQSNLRALKRAIGLRSCLYVYRITDAGLKALEHEKARRRHLGFEGFDPE